MFVSVFSPEKGIPFVVTPVCRHQCTSRYMDLQTPTHCRLVVVLTGVIYAAYSELRIDGDAMFTNNSAEGGGENGRGTCTFNACTSTYYSSASLQGSTVIFNLDKH